MLCSRVRNGTKDLFSEVKHSSTRRKLDLSGIANDQNIGHFLTISLLSRNLQSMMSLCHDVGSSEIKTV
jgi:hypothetical protein